MSASGWPGRRTLPAQRAHLRGRGRPPRARRTPSAVRCGGGPWPAAGRCPPGARPAQRRVLQPRPARPPVAVEGLAHAARVEQGGLRPPGGVSGGEKMMQWEPSSDLMRRRDLRLRGVLLHRLAGVVKGLGNERDAPPLQCQLAHHRAGLKSKRGWRCSAGWCSTPASPPAAPSGWSLGRSGRAATLWSVLPTWMYGQPEAADLLDHLLRVGAPHHQVARARAARQARGGDRVEHRAQGGQVRVDVPIQRERQASPSSPARPRGAAGTAPPSAGATCQGTACTAGPAPAPAGDQGVDAHALVAAAARLEPALERRNAASDAGFGGRRRRGRDAAVWATSRRAARPRGPSATAGGHGG